MKRRTCLQLSAAALLGIGRSRAAETALLQAGPFSVSVPSDWSATAIVEKVPLMLGGPNLCFLDRPQHWALRFPAAILSGQTFDAKGAGENETAPQILIHKAEEWSTHFTLEFQNYDRLARLRAELDEGIQGTFPRGLPTFGAGALNFICLKKELAFHGGSGLRIVCQRLCDLSPVRRGALHYLFCGLSENDSCQIIATFPLDHPDLPDARGKGGPLGRTGSEQEELERDFLAYQAEATKWIEENVDGFSPSLETLDGIIRSLEAKRWE